MEACRDAAAEGVRALGYQPKRSEDYGASPSSPQAVCLAGVRDSEALVLILGQRYGHVQSSGLSATHEEYREAKQRLDVLVFVERGVTFEPAQEEFVREVQDWARGHYTDEFSSPAELRDLVSRRLHELAMSKAAGKVDEADLVRRAEELVDLRAGNDAILSVVVVPGPRQSVVSLTKLEDESFRAQLQQEAQFGRFPVMTRREAVAERMRGDTLEITQGTRLISLNESADMRIDQNASSAERDWHQVLIEEQLTERLANAVRYAGWILDQVDGPNRLSDVVVSAALLRCSYHAWRTMEQQQASPNSVTLSNLGDRVVVRLSPAMLRRSALLHDTEAVVEELIGRLRRAARS